MQRRGLRFEHLERRLLLAGDVNWVVNRGSLVVTGDDDSAGNQIEIAYLGSGVYRLTGSGGTTLGGGQDGPFDVGGVTKAVTVDLKNGDNQLSMIGDNGFGFVVLGDLTVRSGSGQDTVEIKVADIRGKLTVSTGAGDDEIVLDGGSVAKDASILTGDGDDEVGIQNVTFRGKLTVNTGNGEVDRVGMDGGIVFKDASLLTGSGDDEVGIRNTEFRGKLTVNTGNGDDKVGIEGVIVAKDTSVLTGNDSDQVGFRGGNFRGKLTVNTGPGDDQVGTEGIGVAPITPVTVAKDVSILTGDGDDVVMLQNLNVLAKLTVNTGNGNDTVGVFDSYIRGNVSILTGEGADDVGLMNVASPASITVNAGNNVPPAGVAKEDFQDRIGVAGVQAKTMTLDGGDSSRGAKDWGQAQIGVTGTTVTGNLTIRGGGARDTVGVGDDEAVIDALMAAFPASIDLDDWIGRVEVGGTLNISTGNALDRVAINSLTAKTFKMDTGSEDDEVYIGAGIVVTSQLTIKLGDGDDLLVLLSDDIAYPLRTSIDGGKGTDHLPWPEGQVRPSVFTNFEVFTPLPV